MRHTRVAVVIPSLLGGGAERVAVDLANHWSRQSRQVTLITLDRGDQSLYSVLPEVQRIGLDFMIPSRSVVSAVRNNLARILRLRRALRRSEATAVVSFMDITNVTTLLARPRSLRTIISERIDPRHHAIGRIWGWLRRRTYGRASALVVQTETVRRWAESHSWGCRIEVIPNAAPRWGADPLGDAACGSESSRGALTPAPIALRSATILGIGRLSPQKGFDQLIEAFARLASQFPEWQLKIYGEGSERTRLENLIRGHGLRDRVHLPGWIKEVEAAYAAASIFVLPSRYEGFPNALLEAMASGVACISFDCDSGPREIIRHGVDGLLVPAGDIPGLTEALSSLLQDSARREELARQAPRVATRFAPDQIYQLWDDLLDREE